LDRYFVVLCLLLDRRTCSLDRLLGTKAAEPLLVAVMLPSFVRQGAPIRSAHPSTYALVLVTLLSLVFFLSPSRSVERSPVSIQEVIQHEPVAKATTNRLYPQVVVLGDSIAERSFDEAEGYGIKLTTMVRNAEHMFRPSSSRSMLLVVRWQDGRSEPWIRRVVSVKQTLHTGQ